MAPPYLEKMLRKGTQPDVKEVMMGIYFRVAVISRPIQKKLTSRGQVVKKAPDGWCSQGLCIQWGLPWPSIKKAPLALSPAGLLWLLP
jgi:hypothetical protein